VWEETCQKKKFSLSIKFTIPINQYVASSDDDLFINMKTPVKKMQVARNA